jgi:hypothetical protein
MLYFLGYALGLSLGLYYIIVQGFIRMTMRKEIGEIGELDGWGLFG